MIAPSFSITVDGKKVDTLVKKSVLQVACDLQLNLATEATLLFFDPDYRLADSDLFPLGSEIELAMGQGAGLERLMLGEIISLEPQLDMQGTPLLRVRAYDKSHRLRRHQSARPPFLNLRDSQIAAQIAQDAGLDDEVEETPIIHEYLQQTGSDWSFLRGRAQANGFELFVNFTTLVFRRLPLQQRPVHVVKRGVDLLEIGLRLTAINQPGQHVVRSWDAKQKQALVAQVTPDTFNGNLLGKRLGAQVVAETLETPRELTMAASVFSQNEAERLAQAEFQAQAQSFISGEGICIGKAAMKAGDRLEIKGMGQRFGGQYYLTQVTHIINDKGYRTRFAFERNGA